MQSPTVLKLFVWASMGLCVAARYAAANTNPPAVLSANTNTLMGYAYEMGKGVPRDLRKACAYYARGVHEGDAEAQYRLGYAYQAFGAVAGHKLAARLFSRASAQGHPDGTYWLGIMCEWGKGVPRDLATALRHLRKAADAGQRQAIATIGHYHRFGEGIPVNYTEAMRWFKLAASLGEATAMSNIADMYWHGQGVKKDYNESMYWRYRAYNAGRIEESEWLIGSFGGSPNQLRAYEQRRISESGKKRLVIRIGDSAERVRDLLGEPKVPGRFGIKGENGAVWTYRWEYDVGQVEIRSNVVVSSTIQLTSDDYALGIRRRPSKGWRVYPTLSPDDPKYWALATSALLTEYNRNRHDLLGTEVRSEENARTQAWSSLRWWDIGNREDLLEKLRWIDVEGHRADFDRIARAFAAKAKPNAQIAADFQKKGFSSYKIMVAQGEGPTLGAKSILGWDYCRHVSLCRWGYLIGYLTEEEAWSRIMPVAKMLQSTFDSWGDLGQNYLIGRRYWSEKKTTSSGGFEKTYRWLLEDSKSPWKRCAWDMDLSGKKPKQKARPVRRRRPPVRRRH